MTTSPPILGLLLDVDGPIASPISRSINIPSIAKDLAFLANAGVPIIFNTGRSDAFIRNQVVPPLLAAGLQAHARVHAVCEKGASWFTITPEGAGEVHIDASLATPPEYSAAVRDLVARGYSDIAFFDETKHAMVSVEQRTDVDNATYLARQRAFDMEAIARLTELGFGVRRNDEEFPDARGAIQYRCDPTIISTDIESVALGKDLGARRALELLAGSGPLPEAWRTVGDSRTDYAMADWLFEQGHAVSHVDVRPKDGIPATPYTVLTAGDLIHDEAGAAYLARWVEMVRGDRHDEIGVGEGR
jgi:hypothetical protein